jgi:hypothetical protein
VYRGWNRISKIKERAQRGIGLNSSQVRQDPARPLVHDQSPGIRNVIFGLIIQSVPWRIKAKISRLVHFLDDLLKILHIMSEPSQEQAINTVLQLLESTRPGRASVQDASSALPVRN